jgi:hypothetical protein
VQLLVYRHCNDRSTQLRAKASARCGIDVKGIMTNDAVVIIGTGQGGLQLAASARTAPAHPHRGMGG